MDMHDIQEQLDDHEIRIKSLEDTRLATIKTLGEMDTKHEQRLRDVKQDLTDRIKQLDESAKERDNLNSERLTRTEDTVHRIEDKIDSAVQAVRDAPPAWVGPLIGVLSGVVVVCIGSLVGPVIIHWLLHR